MKESWQARRSTENKIRRNDHRNAYQRDRARVLHSAAFRRLQTKTQIHGTGHSDFYRTRLTHSLETAQIGAGIHAQLLRKYPEKAQLLGPPILIETLCLAHDLGHPPFGHGGEIALNYMMRNAGGFEGNGQTFRIATTLEPYTQHHGMNLARRTLLGLIKYPVMLSQVSQPLRSTPITHARELKADQWHPAKSLYDCDQAWFDWVLADFSHPDRELFCQHKVQPNQHSRAIYKSLDCSVMEIADDIAYAIHDLEDAINLAMITPELWQQAKSALIALQDPWLLTHIEQLSQELFSPAPYLRKNAIGSLVNYFITAIKLNSTLPFESELLSHNAYLPPESAEALKVFKDFVFNHVIRSCKVQSAGYKGQQIIMALFDAYASDPERLLPNEPKQAWLQGNDLMKMRAIADWISSLTDQSAQRTYHDLFA